MRVIMVLFGVLTLVFSSACEDGEFQEENLEDSGAARGVSTGCVRYVDELAKPGGDGLSWRTAFNSFEIALSTLEVEALQEFDECEIFFADNEKNIESESTAGGGRGHRSISVPLFQRDRSDDVGTTDTVAESGARGSEVGAIHSANADFATVGLNHSACEIGPIDHGWEPNGDYMIPIAITHNDRVQVKYDYSVDSWGIGADFWVDASNAMWWGAEGTTNCSSGCDVVAVKFREKKSHVVYGTGSADDVLYFSSRQAENSVSDAVTFDNDGNVGVGLISPSAKLHILAGSNQLKLEDSATNDDWTFNVDSNELNIMYESLAKVTINETGYLGIYDGDPQRRLHVTDTANQLRLEDSQDHSYYDFSVNDDHLYIKYGQNTKFTIDENGHFGFLTVFTDDYEMTLNGDLGVNGKIECEELEVKDINLADYVFKDGYELMSLEDVEEHIEIYGHLPGIMSEEEASEYGMPVSVRLNPS